VIFSLGPDALGKLKDAKNGVSALLEGVGVKTASGNTSYDHVARRIACGGGFVTTHPEV
jgi:hypothetical protein